MASKRWRIVGTRGKDRAHAAWPLHVPDRALHLPRGLLVRIGVDARGDGCRCAAAFLRPGRARLGLGGGDDGPLRAGVFVNVAVPFEDLFGGDVGGTVEEATVGEDGLQIFGNL